MTRPSTPVTAKAPTIPGAFPKDDAQTTQTQETSVSRTLEKPHGFPEKKSQGVSSINAVSIGATAALTIYSTGLSAYHTAHGTQTLINSIAPAGSLAMTWLAANNPAPKALAKIFSQKDLKDDKKD